MKPEQQPIALLLPTRLFPPAIVLLLAATVLFCSALYVEAGSATWSAAPISGNWNNSRNWTPKTVPNGSSDISSFATSSLTDIAITVPTEVTSIVFKPGASSFSISDIPTLGLTISGAGVQNNSGTTQTFVAAPGDFGVGDFNFTNTATAGSLVAFDVQGGTFSGQGGGVVQFYGNANAGQAEFAINGAQDLEGGSGSVIFYDSSSAAGAAFSLSAGTGSAASLLQFRGASSAGSSVCSTSGVIYFLESATAAAAQISVLGAASESEVSGALLMGDTTSAGSATIVGYGGAMEASAGAGISFFGSSSAANSTLIANGEVANAGGAVIYFSGASVGGTCSVILNGAGSLSIATHDPPGITVGSLEGDGTVSLGGGNNLVVGSNERDTTFAGSITGLGGTMTKIGAGTLTLNGSSSYPGGTIVTTGTLVVMGKSATGSGPVDVTSGTLAGTGQVSGAITLGVGSVWGGTISPGVNGAGRLSTRGSLIINAASYYLCDVSASNTRADQVVAKRVTIYGGYFFVTPLDSIEIPVGTVFTVINNTSRFPIAGTFGNLPDGSTFSDGVNTYQANYEGGTGNDLTLTVVPQNG